MRRLFIVLAFLILINIVWNVFLFVNPDKQTPYNFLFNASYGLILTFGSLVAFLGARRHAGSPVAKSLVFYALGLMSYAVGLFIWTFYNLVLQVEIPYPGVSDIFFVLFQPLAALAFFYLVKSAGGEFTTRSKVELVVIFVFLFAMLYSLLLKGGLEEELPLLTRILNLGYPAFDAFLAALAITGIRTEKGTLHPNLLVFAFAALIMTFADTTFSYRSAQGTYWNGDMADTLYLISSSLFALAITLLVTSLKDRSPETPYSNILT